MVQSMENIPLNSNEQTYARTKVVQLFKEFTKKLKLEEAERVDGLPLHQDIQQELGESSPSTIQANIRRFVREVPKIEGGEWTTSEAINKEFSQELKERKIDAYQHVNSKYKDAERLPTSAKVTASIYHDIRQAYEDQDEEELLRNIEQLRQLAIYEWTLPRRWFQHLQHIWGKRSMKVDLRTENQSPTSDLLEPSSGPISDSSGCISTELTEGGFVFESTVETDPQGDTTTVLHQGSRSSPDHSVANTVLVVHADKAEVDRPADNNEDKKLDFDRLEVIKHKREGDGIAADTQSFLNQQIRPSTSKTYGYGWRVFAGAITINLTPRHTNQRRY
ncbi:hypothetical protein RMATCC62417_14185 [Rhizopus microsporus]|nr:hypothetical protein RMATCC62417_14185 [Rhizopus microsporus]